MFYVITAVVVAAVFVAISIVRNLRQGRSFEEMADDGQQPKDEGDKSKQNDRFALPDDKAATSRANLKTVLDYPPDKVPMVTIVYVDDDGHQKRRRWPVIQGLRMVRTFLRQGVRTQRFAIRDVSEFDPTNTSQQGDADALFWRINDGTSEPDLDPPIPCELLMILMGVDQKEADRLFDAMQKGNARDTIADPRGAAEVARTHALAEQGIRVNLRRTIALGDPAIASLQNFMAINQAPERALAEVVQARRTNLGMPSPQLSDPEPADSQRPTLFANPTDPTKS
ncbi:hypothetical protein H6758_01745 [Candidatus Nomurabacteria bacterium]|nr:hypothetical protein [Candidatus Nomurabacteria bacterium]